jgi:hypothetical protein
MGVRVDRGQDDEIKSAGVCGSDGSAGSGQKAKHSRDEGELVAEMAAAAPMFDMNMGIQKRPG